MRPKADDLHRILACGIQAPSAENKHFVRFQILDDHVRLLTTDRASWAERPHRRLLNLLACGAVVENMALCSAAQGLALVAEWWPDATRPDLVAALSWAPAAGPADPLLHAIGARHTNRRFYRRARLPPTTLARLTAACEAVPGARVRWLDDPPLRALALTALRIAETERFRRRALHQELFGSIRFDAGWAAPVDEWLAPATLEVEAPMRPAFALLRHWPAMRAATWLGAHHVLGWRAGYLPCALAPHLGLLLGSGAQEGVAQLQAGRGFERLWLAAAAEGLALQPMAAATVMLQQRAGAGWVSARTKARLEQLLGALQDGPDVQPCLLFRLGTATAPSAVSARPPLPGFLG